MRLIFLILTMLMMGSAFGQTGNRYWVAFADKNNSPYSLNNPSTYLSQRSIDRRTRQGIALDSTDLPVNPAYIDSVIARGATVRHSSKWLNGVSIEVPNLQVLQSIQALPFVRQTQKNGRVAYTRDYKPMGKFLVNPEGGQGHRVSRLTNMNYGASYNQIRLHNGDVLHNLGYMGQGMRIAVFDAGFVNVDILACFDSLYLENRVVDTYDFVDLNSNVYVFDSHGTFVLGCMAGIIPGELIGTAPKAEYMLYRTENNVGGSENSLEEDNWVAAAERADSAGADVFNTSLAYTTFDDTTMNYTYADMDGNTARITIGSDFAAKKGILVVASAGNYGGGSWTYVGAPADGDSVLSIGAVNAEGERVGFSSIGPTADGRIKPNVMAQGSAAVSCQVNGPSISFVSGTSFSGPIMAGLVSCLWQAFPNQTNMQIFEAVQRSGSNAGSPNNQIGYGIPNLQQALTTLGVRASNALMFDFEAFPNPFTSNIQVQFQLDIAGMGAVKMYDLAGRVVYEEELGWFAAGAQAFSIEVPSNIHSGLYVIEFSTPNARAFQKLIKQ